MLVRRIVAQDSFIFVCLGLLMLFIDVILGSGGRRRGQGQQRTVSVVRCNVCWRSQVRFLTACVIARRVRALVSVKRRIINGNSLSVC